MSTGYIRCAAAVALAVFMHPGSSGAQDEAARDKEREKPRVQASVSSFYIPVRSLKGETGKISVAGSQAEVALNTKVLEELPVTFALGVNHYALDDSSATGLPAQLTGMHASAQATAPFFALQNAYLRVKVAALCNTDDWQLHSSAMRFPVQAYAIFTPDDRWVYILGFGVYPDHYFGSEVVPFAGFKYKPNDRLTVSLLPPRPEVSYAMTRSWETFLNADFTRGEFEVTRNGQKGVPLRYSQSAAGGGIRLKASSFARVSLSGGYAWNRSFKYGDDLGKAKPKSGVYVQVSGEFNF
jgi:hypothetical protein